VATSPRLELVGESRPRSSSSMDGGAEDCERSGDDQRDVHAQPSARRHHECALGVALHAPGGPATAVVLDLDERLQLGGDGRMVLEGEGQTGGGRLPSDPDDSGDPFEPRGDGATA
jgi:hypothetical protein